MSYKDKQREVEDRHKKAKKGRYLHVSKAYTFMDVPGVGMVPRVDIDNSKGTLDLGINEIKRKYKGRNKAKREHINAIRQGLVSI